MSRTIVLIIALLVYSCTNSKQVNMKNSAEFDFESSGPVEFLDFLGDEFKCRDFEMVVPFDLTNGWVKKEELQILVERLESKRITCPVYSSNAGIDLSFKPRSTEGLESYLIIEAFRTNSKYPMKSGSKDYGFFANEIYQLDSTKIKTVVLWYNQFKNKKN